MIRLTADVVKIESANDFVQKVFLKPSKPYDFKAGQYLQVVMGEDDKRPFSIANSPYQKENIELHIGASPDNAYAYQVIELLKNQGKAEIEIALGEAYLREDALPIVVIAGGTGYSYAKSIVYQVLKTQPERPISLYWGAKIQSDLYEFAELEQLATNNTNFHFVPVLENPPSEWSHKTGLVHQAALSEIQNLENVQLYTAGRFEMAATVREEFLQHGLSPSNLFGDAFAFI